ncbi:hypothetical protein ACFT7S_19415 [Streptomyces sp. NPDC057136]|uniref:hypothetical protein n=1 Tax=Streptomyces sp. NPDC057136 TaxID=3346029 RepID=UPI00362E7567
MASTLVGLSAIGAVAPAGSAAAAESDRQSRRHQFGLEAGLLSYRRLVTQRQGASQAHFDYADVVEDFDRPTASTNAPTARP